jgi:hypothetical protein
MNDHIPTVEETLQAVTEAKASPIFAAAYDAVFGHIRATNRAEALKAAYDAYNVAYDAADAADAAHAVAYDAYNVAYAAYEAEVARINKEYPL